MRDPFISVSNACEVSGCNGVSEFAPSRDVLFEFARVVDAEVVSGDETVREFNAESAVLDEVKSVPEAAVLVASPSARSSVCGVTATGGASAIPVSKLPRVREGGFPLGGSAGNPAGGPAGNVG